MRVNNADNPDYDPIDVVARQMLSNATDSIQWEDYPDMGEIDFIEALNRAKWHGRSRLSAEHYKWAYDRLAARAEAEA